MLNDVGLGQVDCRRCLRDKPNREAKSAKRLDRQPKRKDAKVVVHLFAGKALDKERQNEKKTK